MHKHFRTCERDFDDDDEKKLIDLAITLAIFFLNLSALLCENRVSMI